jgi:hypothetical protein
MEIGKTTVDRLTKAWLKETKRLRASSPCDCGCGEAVSMRTRFRPGHDAKLLKDYREKIEAILRGQSN